MTPLATAVVTACLLIAAAVFVYGVSLFMYSSKVTRPYRSGTRWCLWRWTKTDSGYLTRLHLVMTPWFSVCVHWLHKPDPEPYLHDHPVSFVSLILRGWYEEVRRKPREGVTRIIRHRWINVVRATPEDRHTIVEVAPRTVTLAFMGPKRREWGFLRVDEVPHRWQYWKDYYREKRAAARAEATAELAEFDALRRKLIAQLEAAPPTELERQWQSLDFAHGNLLCSSNHKPTREAFAKVAADRYGWDTATFDRWAEGRTWRAS